MIEIPARKGKSTRLNRGETVKVINTTGQQVVDTWAFNAADLREFMSMEHSRVALGHIMPAIGDTLVTNRRRPILTVLEDTSGGIHDTLFAACDRWRYELLGCEGYHDNCTDNLAAALAELGLAPPEVPAPLNLFMNIPVIDGNRVEVRPPVSTPGSHIALRAEIDCVLAFSACPQDLLPVNGLAMRPTHAHFMILDQTQSSKHDYDGRPSRP
ncbi:MAG: urea carboxylase-associated family protein [Alphaproteobacteria bacterium]|nr:urea carboxylase-associated family protein [Alphaproteobacteria bacterium]